MSRRLPDIDATALSLILTLRAAGKSYHEIAAQLNHLGMKGFLGGRWYGATVYRVVRGYGNLPKEIDD